ncbi:hypothetical protein HanLR1_Chr15g0584751 [Helianthus annuus]|nr:hypothetical protein HanHA89_Chr15g0623671 [Helianthus annuus]KAJ0649481.1 hypothetical protein HanLR1_Chr15g0584751 [Helianthus annuus]
MMKLSLDIGFGINVELLNSPATFRGIAKRRTIKSERDISYNSSEPVSTRSDMYYIYTIVILKKKDTY